MMWTAKAPKTRCQGVPTVLGAPTTVLTRSKSGLNVLLPQHPLPQLLANLLCPHRQLDQSANWT